MVKGKSLKAHFAKTSVLLSLLTATVALPAQAAPKQSKKVAKKAVAATKGSAAAPAPASNSVWKAEVPAQLKEPGPWIDLAHALLDQGMYYGALATAARMRVFFADLPTKEVAYMTMVSVIDHGYPFPIYEYFMGADIDPEGPYDFANSFHLYKSVLSKQKGMSRWAEHYLESVDTVHFHKYQLLVALEAYERDDYKTAEDALSKILAADTTVDELPLIRKASRTLARIYFEKGQYERSLDVYNSFLLNLNPVSPGDWLEAAWDYYHLKRYDQALGMLYNLESDATDPTISLEKYNLRALIYRDQCALSNMEALAQDFDRVFGKVIDGIKVGENLSSFPLLRTIEIPGNQLFNRVNITLANLKAESEMLEHLPKNLKNNADYIYRTEMRMLSQEMRSTQEAAVQNAASQLILVSEQLRFLKFDSVRSKFNPDIVFGGNAPSAGGDEKKAAASGGTEAVPGTNGAEEIYELRWLQFGDYWRDERLKYRGVLPNLCSS